MCCTFCLFDSPFLFSMIRRQPIPTLFPYTTLFRSKGLWFLSDGVLEDYRGPEVSLWEISNRGHFSDSERFISTCSDLQEHGRSEEHTSELQSHSDLVCRLLLEKKKKKRTIEELENT